MSVRSGSAGEPSSPRRMRPWGVERAQLSTAYRATGDLGASLGPFVRPSLDLGLFRETLTPARLSALLDEIAAANGKSAQKRRQIVCEQILAACTDPLEATYVIKIVTGELRIGLREGLIADAGRAGVCDGCNRRAARGELRGRHRRRCTCGKTRHAR